MTGDIYNCALLMILFLLAPIRLRPLSYPGTDCFILMYSIISRSSFENIKECWIPEITHHCGPVHKMPVSLVCKMYSSYV